MKPNIAFVTGGYSGESVISYKSAVTIEKHIDHEKYNVYTIDITTNGWFYKDGNDKAEVDKNDFSITVNNKKISFDAVLIGIHGTPGEDGKLQGYFDLMNLPYTSCDAAISALTFNKRYTVAVAAFSGINVARSVVLIKDQFESADEAVKDLQFPVFVKPNNGGSSIGMSKVNQHSEELGKAVAKAFNEDDQVLIEEFINGREFTIGVFKSNNKIITLPITEVISKKDFFDYEAKYTTGMANEITPAEVSEDIAEQVRETAKKVYKIFNCRGVVRMDFIYNDDKKAPFLLEINTVPGQSEASIVPKQVKAMGWTLKELYSSLIEEALANGKQ
ncbi:MAG: D-alanine--D-alanine ligase [Terrimonas sp.]|uniref:D-alanine--D-alanine ligase n=1 Tax=Terrimonas sp. TaxID=1914338 RepID=UPI00092BE8A5|nr:D-alanine--D-alanine ligase [Terrimonas sp.]MBN8785621.1 D-alanine--D-alanine ligase [Terrimonas sp.]OJY98292.1 MAG: D-alanine--D-alanine ligase A [Sphingobacteriales bacterium 40-81]PVD51711.1 D-alanine--D-alanine ligase [Terrimonas sp.]